MPCVEEVLDQIKEKARPDQLEGMARFGMTPENRLGVQIPVLRKMAKGLGKNHNLALGLWKTGIAEARILAGMIDESQRVTEEQLEEWVKDFNSWDVCDQTCLNLFEKIPLARQKIFVWFSREEEFVKRTAFTLIACLAWHDKKAGDETFIDFFPIIKNGAADERNFVKKAVNWALRNIGKRNARLAREAIQIAKEIKELDSKAARWIATDAIRELESPAVQRRLKKIKNH